MEELYWEIRNKITNQGAELGAWEQVRKLWENINNNKRANMPLPKYYDEVALIFYQLLKEGENA